MIHPQPKLKKLTRIPLPSTEHFTLDSGIKGTLLTCENQPFSRIDFIFSAGSRYQPDRFIARMTNSLLKEGTSQYTSSEIAEHFDFYGSYLQSFCDRDEAGLVLYTLNKHLAQTLEMTVHLLSNASFPQEEFDIQKINNIRSMEVDNERVETIAKKTFFRKLFGSRHPYGEMGEIDDLKKLERRSLIEYKDARYGFDDLRILITTSEPNEVFTKITQWLPVLTVSKDPIVPIPLPEARSEKGSHTVVKKEGAVQAAIRMGLPLFSRAHPNFLDLSILVTIFGGYFGSRLMKNLREDKGYTYGIGSGMISLSDHGYMTIGTTVGADVWEDAMKEIIFEMKKLADQKVTREEIVLVQNYLTGELQRRMDGVYAMADTFRTLSLNHLDFNHISDHLHHINGITSQRLLELAKLYFQPENFVSVVCVP